MDVETLAKSLHEAGREAVEKQAVVNPNIHTHFLEWDELKEHMKEGRRIQARYLLTQFIIEPINPQSPYIQGYYLNKGT